MSSDPSERRRRMSPASTGLTMIVTLAILVVPVLAFSQGLSAANRPEDFGILDSPASIVGLVLVFAGIMALNAIFVAGSSCLEVLRNSHVRGQADGSSEQRKLSFFVENKDSIVAACVLGAQTMRAWLILLCLVPSPEIAMALGWINQPIQPMQFFGASALAATLLSIPVMGVNVVIAELVGRSVAVTHPIDTVLRIGWILKIFNALFKIPGVVALGIANIIAKRFNADARFTIDNRIEEEIKDILDSTTGIDSGGIEVEERELLESVFEFGDTVAREIMTPRVDMESIPVTASLAEIADLVESTGHSRFPIYHETDDNIIGVVHAKDVLLALARNQGSIKIDHIMRPVQEVHESQKLHSLLAEMRAKKAQMVIVKDELGGTSGLVTIEDIVEELVGEIVDEYDQETAEIKEESTGHSVSGKLHLDDINEAIGTEFESEEFDTIGGYVFGLFGRQPAIGETISDSLYHFVIEDSDGRRIQRVRIEPLPQDESLLDIISS